MTPDLKIAGLERIVRRAPASPLRARWLNWLAEYEGPGHYGRKASDARARTVWMRLKSPAMMAWLARSLGVPAPVVRRAAADSQAHANLARSAAAFRRVVDWGEIETRLRGTESGTLSPAALRRAISRFSDRGLETDAFLRAWRRRPVQQEARGVWYQNQKEHWLGWLAEYGGPAAYGRKQASRTARYVYAHVVNPLMLVWLAEATRVERSLRRRAAEAALRERSMPAMSAAFRRIVPWDVVEPRLRRFS